jgi:hypothetical protein
MLTLANANMFSGLAWIFGLIALLTLFVVIGWSWGVAAVVARGARPRILPVASASVTLFVALSCFAARIVEGSTWTWSMLPQVAEGALIPSLISTAIGVVVGLGLRRKRARAKLRLA